MKREEAIKHLEDMKKGVFLWDMTELIDLCISTLSENKGDLISREEARGKLQTVTEWNGEVHRYIDEQSLDSIPSADIMECAREIKEHCEKYDEHCIGCPFHCAKPTLWCALGGSSLPHEWDLPEGEKGGDV